MKKNYTSGLISLLLVSCCTLTGRVSMAQSWARLMAQADSCEAKGQVEQTFAFRKLALDQAGREVGTQHPHYGATLTQLGILLSLKGKAKPAEDTLLLAQRLFQGLGTSADTLLGLNHEAIALLYRRQNRFAEAEQAYFAARKIWEQPGRAGSERYRATLMGLANVYLVQRYYAKAEPLLLDALADSRKANDRSSTSYAAILSSLGTMYNGLEKYAAAEPLAVEALALRRTLFGNDHPSTATSASNLGVIYEKVGDLDRAAQLHREALRIRVKQVPGSADHAVSLQNLAVCMSRMGQKTTADSLYELALTIYAKTPGRQSLNYANTLANQATVRDERGRSAEAARMFSEALQTVATLSGTQNALYSRLLSNAASVDATLGHYARADSLATAALGISNQLTGPATVEYAGYLANRAVNRYGAGHMAQAITDLDGAVAVFNQRLLANFLYFSPTQKEAYLARWGINHPIYFSIAWQQPANQHLAQEAYTFSLFVKNLLLNEHNQLTESITNKASYRAKASFDSLQSLKTAINQQYNLPVARRLQLDSLEVQAERLEKELARQSAPFRAAQQVLRVSWKEVQRALSPTDAAVEFVHFKFHDGHRLTDSVVYMALVLRPGWISPRLVPLMNEKDLARLLSQPADNQLVSKLGMLRGQTQVMTNTGQLAQGKQLYKRIWQPIDTLLRGVKQIWVSPSGLLHNVALATLPYPTKGTNASSAYLADQYVLRHVSSTRSLVTARNVPAKLPRTALLYGGVDYGVGPKDSVVTEKWPELPGTKQEVTSIGTGWGASATVVTGLQATKASLIASTATAPPDVLHLATHGFFRSSTDQRTEFVRITADPVLTRSGVVLAGANVPTTTHDNGILSGLELAGLNLAGTQLVVLSACETGLGDIRGSEGVFGLQRAVKMAGARNLLISLWPVLDGPTGQFMTLFYQNWRRQGAISTAFAQTQRTFRQRYPPAVWAAFVLVE